MIFVSGATTLLLLVSSVQAWDYGVPAGQKNTALPSPPQAKDTKKKLVYDAAHPYIAPGPTDQRGPCPGLNTLANHGYLPRNGIVTPQQVVNATMAGFNLGQDVATMLAFGAFLVDGNPFTNLMSIGAKDSRVGVGPTTPPNDDFGAPNAGLDTHSVFEGDASTTRGDYEFGDNHSFNETLFQQLVEASNKYGRGYYNSDSAAEVRYNRIQDSIANNPNFVFVSPRFTTAYAESSFPYLVWVDGRRTPKQLDLAHARSFFETNRFPDGFWRREGALHLIDFAPEVVKIFQKHPMKAGSNQGKGNYVLAPNDPGFSNIASFCYIGTNAAERIPAELYPNTTGILRDIMRANFKTFYEPFRSLPFNLCNQTVYPFGK